MKYIFKNIRFGDLIIIACALLSAGAMQFAIRSANADAGIPIGAGAGEGAGEGAAAFSAEVKADGAVLGSLPLDTDGALEYENGGRRNVIAVRGGRAYMEEANCPDGLCVKLGAVSEPGAAIVCLPNRVTVRVVRAGAQGAERAAAPTGQVDAVSGARTGQVDAVSGSRTGQVDAVSGSP